MTIRDGMLNLIARLRQLTQAEVNAYTLAGEQYWSNDQLQAILDRYRYPVTRVELTSEPDYVAGSVYEYHNYRAVGVGEIEEHTSGTAVFSIRDSTGGTYGTAHWTADYNAKTFRFTNDTAGSAFFLTTRQYDLRAAAAQVWDEKAAYYSDWYDFDADGASYKRSQIVKHCKEKAAELRAGYASAVISVRMMRTDAW